MGLSFVCTMFVVTLEFVYLLKNYLTNHYQIFTTSWHLSWLNVTKISDLYIKGQGHNHSLGDFRLLVITSSVLMLET